MIELIKGILLESSFDLVEYNLKNALESENYPQINYENYLSIFAIRIEDGKFDFFLTIQVSEDNLDLVELNLVIKYHLEAILKTQKYPGVDKNLSLLLLTERSAIEYSDAFNKIVYEFEENPFHFKRFLLPYTQEQAKLLDNFLNEQFQCLKVILNNKDTIIAQLNEVLSNKHWFSLFKDIVRGSERDEAKIFDLVSKIFIKIPYLKVPINKEDLRNLSNEIEREIPEIDKGVIEKFLKIQNSDPKWEDILETLEVELDEL